MDAQTRILPNQHQAEGVLRALGETLPEADLSRLRGFLSGVAPLDVSDVEARQIVDALKTAADRHWRIDPHRSVELAEAIIAIGEARADVWIRALGTMAKGDAVKFIGSQQEAWDLLEESARLFALVSDEVGWARTWIGRVFVAAQLNRLPEAIAQAERAREIFERHGEMQRQIRIDMALGSVNWQAENHAAAEAHYNRALAAALDTGSEEAGAIYNNLGLIAQSRGDAYRALEYFDRAVHLATSRGEPTAEVICRLNIATSRRQLGQFRQALALLNEIQPHYLKLFGVDTQIRSDMADCLVSLNRLEEAAALYQQTRQDWLSDDARLFAARAALLQAQAAATIGDQAVARGLLDLAEAEFAGLGENGLTALVHLRRGQLALHAGDPALALSHADEAACRFEAESQAQFQAETLLLKADALLGLNRPQDAGAILARTLDLARGCASPSLLYSAHLSLGRLAEHEGYVLRALRRYAAAEAVLERMQRNLTVTLRPAFLASKLDAQRARFGLLLRQGDLASAFETAERTRAQIMLGYLSGRESLRWVGGDPTALALAHKLDTLRGRYHALVSRAGDPGGLMGGAAPDSLVALERQMRQLTEQLHLQQPEAVPDMEKPPGVAQLQRALGADEALLAYFDDGARLHAFLIDRGGIEHAALDVTAAEIARALDQLQRNLSRALAAGVDRAGPALLAPAKIILRRLWLALLAPLMARAGARKRLYVVPFGQLHTLPFNLLHDGVRYLIELVEVVTLTSASLLLRPPPIRPVGARIVVHDNDGHLPNVEREAAILQSLYPAVVRSGAEANRDALRAPPGQILHIAAHGAYRTDNPDFSHITLADGRLQTDELLQLDLGYELVTLSACETGRGRITAGDEALGVGWAFLYAGAGAVVASQWRVSDARTAKLMASLYGGLHDGLSKSAALRHAQVEMLAESPSAHPAFWGAFQLYGSPAALTRADGDAGGVAAPHI